MLVEKRDPRIPDFEEVKDKVTQAVKQDKAKAQLESTAKQIIEAAKTPGGLKAAAAKFGLETKAEAKYKLANPLGEAGSSALIDNPLYAAKAGDILNPPIFLNSNYLIIGVNTRTEADLTEFAKQRETLMQSALSERKNQVFSDYLSAVQRQMQQSGKITIYEEVLGSLPQEEEPEAAPPRPQVPRTK